MEVNLISVTQSIGELDGIKPTPEQLIAYIARVSNPGNQNNHETADKLMRYLIKNKHWSPFEMVDMTVEITTSRAIAQQILRHRSFSFQEFSQRYAEVSDFEEVHLRQQATTNRQSSTVDFDPEINIDSENDVVPARKASSAIQDHIDYSQSLYRSLLTAGVAKECARMVLPLTTQTRLYMKGSVRSWIHYLQIRCNPHTQLEHRMVASEALHIFKTKFPNIHQALTDGTDQ